HGDHLGSSTLITRNGSSLVRAAYFPYGEDTSGAERLTNASGPPVYRFTFKEKEVTGGFYDFGARLYDARTGRFLTADSVEKDGFNRYAYVHNNPLGATDPTGHEASWWDKTKGWLSDQLRNYALGAKAEHMGEPEIFVAHLEVARAYTMGQL